MSELVTPFVPRERSEEIHRYQKSIAGKFIVSSLRQPDRADFEDQPTDRGDNYVRLSMARYEDFMSSMRDRPHTAYDETQSHSQRDKQAVANKLEQSSGVRHGFLVCGYTLSLGVMAYKNTVQEQSVGDLTSALMHEETINKTIVLLANMDNDRNRVWEEWAGLRDGGYYLHQQFGSFPFRFERDKEDKPYMMFNIDVMTSAIRETLDIPRGEAYEVCPAAHFLPMIWQNMVEQSAYDPRLFAADLA